MGWAGVWGMPGTVKLSQVEKVDLLLKDVKVPTE